MFKESLFTITSARVVWTPISVVPGLPPCLCNSWHLRPAWRCLVCTQHVLLVFFLETDTEAVLKALAHAPRCSELPVCVPLWTRVTTSVQCVHRRLALPGGSQLPSCSSVHEFPLFLRPLQPLRIPQFLFDE